jgi:hypothetical protein
MNFRAGFCLRRTSYLPVPFSGLELHPGSFQVVRIHALSSDPRLQAVLLPTCTLSDQGKAIVPARLHDNIETGYAVWIAWQALTQGPDFLRNPTFSTQCQKLSNAGFWRRGRRQSEVITFGKLDDNRAPDGETVSQMESTPPCWNTSAQSSRITSCLRQAGFTAALFGARLPDCGDYQFSHQRRVAGSGHHRGGFRPRRRGQFEIRLSLHPGRLAGYADAAMGPDHQYLLDRSPRRRRLGPGPMSA